MSISKPGGELKIWLYLVKNTEPHKGYWRGGGNNPILGSHFSLAKIHTNTVRMCVWMTEKVFLRDPGLRLFDLTKVFV